MSVRAADECRCRQLPTVTGLITGEAKSNYITLPHPEQLNQNVITPLAPAYPTLHMLQEICLNVAATSHRNPPPTSLSYLQYLSADLSAWAQQLRRQASARLQVLPC